jgi:hypothetical protein
LVDTVIALLALAVSIGAVVWQARTAREQTRIAGEQTRLAREQTAIQERLAAIDEARRTEEVEAKTLAHVTASFRRRAETWLVLRNEGPALASNVDLDVEQGPSIPPVDGIEALPIDLQPGQERIFYVPESTGDAATMRVTVSWTDGAGRHEKPFMLQLHY